MGKCAPTMPAAPDPERMGVRDVQSGFSSSFAPPEGGTRNLWRAQFETGVLIICLFVFLWAMMGGPR